MIIDNDMIYDEARRRYVLSENYVQNELGLNLLAIAVDELDTNPTTLPSRILKRTSNMVYEFMQLRCRSFGYACELIENDQEMHDAFKDCLSYQLESFVMTGDEGITNKQVMQDNYGVCERAYKVLYGKGLLDKVRPLARC